MVTASIHDVVGGIDLGCSTDQSRKNRIPIREFMFPAARRHQPDQVMFPSVPAVRNHPRCSLGPGEITPGPWDGLEGLRHHRDRE